MRARVSIMKTDWPHQKKHPKICGAPLWWRPQTWKEMFRGQTPACVFAYNDAVASVTFSGHGASAYLVWVRRYCSELKERSDKALQALFYFLLCSFISKNPTKGRFPELWWNNVAFATSRLPKCCDLKVRRPAEATGSGKYLTFIGSVFNFAELT